MSQYLKGNVIVERDGKPVTLYGGTELPEWARDKVPAALIRGAVVASSKPAPAEAFGVKGPDDEDDDEPRVAFKGK